VANSSPKATKIDYYYSGPYDRVKFLAEFTNQFGNSPRYNVASVPEMLTLVGLIESDPLITDVRWAAYMLATVMWETTIPTTVKSQALNRKRGSALR
jgi:hypothetical protein